MAESCIGGKARAQSLILHEAGPCWAAPCWVTGRGSMCPPMREISHFIDGAAVKGTSGQFGEVFNPNTGEVQARVALARAEEQDAAVQSAHRAPQQWAQVNP